MIKAICAVLIMAFTLCGCSGSSSQPVTLSSINVLPATATLAPGTTKQFRATGVYSNGSMIDISDSVTWSSANGAVASISNAPGSQGLATAAAAGTTTISATSGTVTGSATLTTASVQSIAVTPTGFVGVVGSSQQFRATATLSNGATQDLSSLVSWSSSDPSVATISTSGILTALGTGTVTVSATTAGITGSTSVRIERIVSLTVAAANTTGTATLGDTLQFVATGTLSDGTTRDVSTLVTWSAADTQIATVASNGVATAVAPGTTTITAAFPGIASASAAITVQGPTSITVTPPNPSAIAGATQQFNAMGTFPDGSNRDVTRAASWSSSSTAVASISSSGLASAVGTGTTLITASVGGISGSTALTVKTLSSLTVSPTTPSVGVGTSAQLTATGTMSDGSTQDLTNLVTWSSGTPAIATVSNTAGSKGIVVGKAIGSATVTASFAGISKSVVVTVTQSAFPNNFALVTDSGTSFLSVIDAGSNAVVSSILVQGAPRGVAFDPSTRIAYVANNNNSTVSVVDLVGGKELFTIGVGAGPSGVALSTATRRLYVSNSQAGTVSVIDTGSNTLLTNIRVGTSPGGMALNTANNRLYVANFGSNTVSVIDTTSNTLVGTISVGLGPVDLALNPVTGLVYVVNSFSSTLSVINSALNTVTANIPVGQNAQGIALIPARNRAYVSIGSSLSVIDTTNNSVVASIPVGTGAAGVAVSPSLGRVFVANSGSNSVSVIDASTNTVIAMVTGLVGASGVAATP
jgi:trimeric autotransporter adhesin